MDVCKRLWEDWGYEDAGPSRRPVQVYSVNIPLLEHVLELETRKVCWTSMWRNAYGGLFKSTKRFVSLHLQRVVELMSQ